MSLAGWLLDVDDLVDFAMSHWCEKHECFTVWPLLVGAHMAAGRMAKDSDIIHGDDKDGWERLRAEKDEVREEGTTWNVAHSARLAALKQAGHDEAKSKVT